MKIVLITTANHIYSNYIIKKLIEARNGNIDAIIESKTLLYKKSFIEAISKYFKTSGVYYITAQGIKQEAFKFISLIYRIFRIKNPLSIFYSYKLLANKYSIPIYETKNINDAESIKLIENLNTDILVSIYFNQIVGSKLLNKVKNCINIHPAYLPNYKGVSPIFWAIANKESYSGVTVHYINKGIDTGAIIYQKKVPILPEDTEHSLYFKCCEEGSPLLVQALQDIETNQVNISNIKNEEGSYYSLPTKQAVSQFRKDKRKFFRLRNFKLIFNNYK